MINVYNYEKPHEFVREAWLQKKAHNKSFSLRAWAKKLGMKNNTPLSLFLNGQRGIPRKYIRSIIEDLHLTEDEGTFLEVLLDRSTAKTEKDREFYTKKLEKLKPAQKNLSIVPIDIDECFSNPLHFLLYDLIDCVDFKEDPEWISQKIDLELSEEEIKEAFDRLIELKLVIRLPSGDLYKVFEQVTNHWDIPSEAIQKCHQKASEYAQKQVQNIPVDNRDFHVHFFFMDKEKMAAAKKEVQSFMTSFLEKYSEINPQNKKDLFEVNLQLFPVTK